MIDCTSAIDILWRSLLHCVSAQPCDCILLSGGIDTSLVALAAVKKGVKPLAVTVYSSFGLPRDLPYAIHVAHVLGLEHVLVEVDSGTACRLLKVIQRCVGRYDYIEYRNDVVFLAGLVRAQREGCKCIYTGDGGDELLAGYRFMLLEDEARIDELRLEYARRGRYPGLELAECIGIEAYAPLLCDEVIEAAMLMRASCLRSNRDPWEGKHPARVILEQHGLGWVAWRVKTPAESGAGTSKLGEKDLRVLSSIC